MSFFSLVDTPVPSVAFGFDVSTDFKGEPARFMFVLLEILRGSRGGFIRPAVGGECVSWGQYAVVENGSIGNQAVRSSES